jgi:hypothetical protein
MIRFRFPGLRLPVAQAAACAHPRLHRLADCGPWTARLVDGAVELELAVGGWSPAGWDDWQDGRDGCRMQLATNPALAPLRRAEIPAEAQWVRFASGERAPIAPAYCEGLDLSLDGEIGRNGPGPYWGALTRFCAVGAQATWQDAVPLALAAIRSTHRCPDELAVRLRLLTTADVGRLAMVAMGEAPNAKKADPGNASSSVDSPASTGAEPPTASCAGSPPPPNSGSGSADEEVDPDHQGHHQPGGADPHAQHQADGQSVAQQ